MLSVSGRPRSLPEVSPAPLGTARQGRVGHPGAPRTLTSTLFFKNSSEAAVLTGAACFPCRARGRREVGGRGYQTWGTSDRDRGGARAEGGRLPSSPTARCSPGFGPSPPAAPWRRRRRPVAASRAGRPGPPPTAAAGSAGTPWCRPRAPAPAALASPRPGLAPPPPPEREAGKETRTVRGGRN